MKKKEKVKLTKFFIFCVITILAVISSYYLDFKDIKASDIDSNCNYKGKKLYILGERYYEQFWN